MSDDVLERYFSQTIASGLESGMGEVHFAWQGGEPTMLGVEYFRKIVTFQKKTPASGCASFQRASNQRDLAR